MNKFIKLSNLIIGGCFIISIITIFFSLKNSDTSVQSIIPTIQTAAVYDFNSNLIARYTFDDGTAVDTSGKGNNGSLVGGPTLITGKVGNGALMFDGVDDYVSITHNSNINIGTDNFAISFWFKKTNSNDTYQSLISKNIDNSNGPGISIFLRETIPNIKLGIGNSTSVMGVNGSPITNTDWQHVVITREQNNKLSLYLNGILNTNSTVNDTLGDISNNVNLAFGKGNSGINIGGPARQGYFKGSLDDVRIYNRSLTASEVTDLYNFQETIVPVVVVDPVPVTPITNPPVVSPTTTPIVTDPIVVVPQTTTGNPNLLKNSSFETPGDNFWGFGGSKISESNLVEDAVHGKYSLRWPYTHPMTDWPSANPYTGQHFGSLVYESVAAEAGQKYTLSAYIKSTVGTGQMEFQIWDGDRNQGFGSRGSVESALARSPKFNLTSSWQRITWSVILPPALNKYVIRMDFPSDPPWQNPYPTSPRWAGLIDAVKFEKGDLTDYVTDPIEVGLYPKADANAFTWGEDALVDVFVANSGTESFSGNVDLTVEDFFGTAVSQRSIAMSAVSNQRNKQTVSFGTTLRGHYLITARINGVIKSEKIFSTIPPAKNVNPDVSIFGADSNLSNFMLSLAKRLGITRIRPHSDMAWEFVEPSQNNFVFPDYRVSLAKSKGLQLYGFLYRTPAWARPVGSGLYSMPSNIADWDDFVFKIVDHYKNDIKYWEIYNEPYFQLSSSQYLSLVNTARLAANRADPTAKLMGWSGIVGDSTANYYYKDVKDELLKSINILTAHYYPQPSLNVGTGMYSTLKNHTNVISNGTLPIWNTEGGATGGPTFYKDKEDFDPNDSRKDHTSILSKTWIYHKAANAPLYYYWLNFPDLGAHSPAYTFSWTLNEYDSSLKASAVVTAAAAYFLDGSNIVFNKFIATGDSTNDESVVMAHFIKDSNSSIVTAWTDVPGKTVEIKNNVLPQAVSIYDMFGKNVANFSAGQSMSYRVSNNPIYIIINSYNPSLVDRSFLDFGLVASNESILINETVSGDKNPLKVNIFGSSNTQPSTNELIYSQNVTNGTTVSYAWDAPVHSTDPNTVVLYHFDQRSELGENSTTIKDFSNNNRVGTLLSTTGGTLEFNNTYGKFAGGLKSDGSLLDKSVKIVNDVGLNNLSQFTIEMWLKPISAGTGGAARLFSKGNVSSFFLDMSPYAARLRETGREIVFQVSDGTITRERWSSISFTADNTYHHLAFVFDGSPAQPEIRKMDIYLDGKLINGNLGGTKDGKCPIAQSNPSPTCVIPNFTKSDINPLLLLGYALGGPSSLFNGYIDEFVMYNKALSSTEIYDHAKLSSNKIYYWYTEMIGNTTTKTGIKNSKGETVVTPPTPIIGDFNNDRLVNSLDFSLLVSAWNKNNASYDINHDGIVNSLDYVVMVQNWTQ